MNKYSVTAAAGLIAGAAACLWAAPAMAHGGGGWSVTIESEPQPYYHYQSPPPVFYPQAPFVYGPPPSAFPPPSYRQQWPAQPQGNPYASPNNSWRERDWRERDWRERDWREHGRHDHGRRDDHSRDRWQDNDRRGPGAHGDLPRWGYGERRR